MISFLSDLYWRWRGHWIYDTEQISPCLVKWHCACGGWMLVWRSRAFAVTFVYSTTCAAGLTRWKKERALIPRVLACHCAGVPPEDRLGDR